MMRIFQWLVPVVVLAALGYGAYKYFVARKTYNPEAVYQAIPSDSPFVLEINKLNELVGFLKEGNEVHAVLKSIPEYQALSKQLIRFDSIVHASDGLHHFFHNNDLLITAIENGSHQSDFLFLVGCSNRKSKVATEAFLKNQFAQPDAWKSRRYDKNTIFSVSEPQNLAYACVDGVVLVSTSELLVERAIKQYTGDSNLMALPAFKEILLTAGKNSTANFFINHQKLPGFLKQFIAKDWRKAFEKLQYFSSWSEFDITVKDRELFFNGFSMANEKQDFLKTFIGQDPVDIGIETVLPANTSTFLAFGASDLGKFSDAYRDYQGYNTISNDYLDAIDNLNFTYKFDLEENIFDIIDNEIALAFTKIDAAHPFDNSFLILETTSASTAKEEMLRIIEKYVIRKKIDKDDKNWKTKLKEEMEAFQFNYHFDDEVAKAIYAMPFENLGELLFGSLFANTPTRYFTFVENYLIFAPSRAALGTFVRDNLLHKNLANDFDYLEFSAQTTERSNLYLYTNIASSIDLYPHLLEGGVKSMFVEHADVLRGFQALSYQLAPHSGSERVYNDVYLKYEPRDTDRPQTRWELRLDNNFSHKPWFVKNHATGKREILVQDDAHKLYLINYAGRIIWKKQLNGPIISKVYQIDYYKNNKLQLLFNTKEKIHLIDRLGNYVERYPINLSSHATNGLCLVDYDNKKEYRIFIASADKRVSLYSKEGNKIEGWKFKKSEHEVSKPVQYFKNKDKDYLVFTDSNRSYFLNRRGKTRLNPEEKIVVSKNGNFEYEPLSSLNKARLVTSGPDGTVYFVYFDGKVESIKFEDFSEHHYFEYTDVDQDGIRDFVFVDENRMIAYNRIKSKIFSNNFDQDITYAPNTFRFPGPKVKIGIVAEKMNEIYLINSDGAMYQGFPLTGRTPFSIGAFGNSSRFNLFVGTDDNFLYNYEVK